MSCTDALRAHQADAGEKPDREEIEPIDRDRIEFQLGYRLGWHHAMQDAIDIAEEQDD